MTSAQKAATIAAFVALALWFPLTRQLILFILPLGKGVDDFFAMILAWVAVLFMAWDKFFHHGTSRQRFYFAFIMTIATGLFAAWLFFL